MGGPTLEHYPTHPLEEQRVGDGLASAGQATYCRDTSRADTQGFAYPHQPLGGGTLERSELFVGCHPRH
jgi:hypothetical protein